MKCPKCGYDAPDAPFCEACGAQLTTASAMTTVAVAASASNPPARIGLACSCGAGPDRIDAQNVCTVCGNIITPPNPRDHLQIRLDPRKAAASDLGHKHWRNEDSVAVASETIEGEPVTVVVISDGVSSSEHPDEASETACKTIVAEVLGALHGSVTDLESMVRNAIFAAQRAVVDIPYSGHKEPPEATVLVVVLCRGVATIGWLGDSRAYRVRRQNGSVSADLLTEDHSWINEMVKAGEMTMEEAIHDRRAHAVTQSLGRLPEGEVLEPSTRTVPLDGMTWLLGCTDGFWNYAHPRQDQPPQPLIDMAVGWPLDGEAVNLAQQCVDFANQHGGHDNVTVAVVSPERT